MDTLNWLNVWATYVFFLAGTPAQGLYAFLYWKTRKWDMYPSTTWYMRGRWAWFLLMFQSSIVLTLYGMRSLDWPSWLIVFRVVSFVLILSVIYGQLFNLLREMAAEWREKR